MNYRKFKSYSLFAAFVLSAIILIGWSQTWFFLEVTFPTENSDGLAVSGQIVAPGLSAFGLAGFAITAALALSSVVIRRILGVLLLGLGIAVVLISISAWSDPVLSAVPQLLRLLGQSGDQFGMRVAERIDRASELLRTRIDLTLEAQNQDLLHSMNRRSQAQLQLQQAVEGLSVVAISYYLVGLVKYAAESLKDMGLLEHPALITGLAVPVCAVLVWRGMRRLRRAMPAA